MAMAVYSDAVPFEALGRITAMPRASLVECDAMMQEWVARDARMGEMVAHGRSRKAVLQDKHEYYVDMIARGRLGLRANELLQATGPV